jgi:phospholipid-binding lipoprotein MlaA
VSKPGRALAPLLLAAALAGGCATTAGSGVSAPEDPWEGFNRKVFSFNEAVDEAVLRPVAEGYQRVVPQLVRTGIGNVFGNIADVWSAANHLLQGKAQHGLDMGMRVLTNTIFGLGGLLDPASEMGLPRRSEDFGQTLGVWGVGPGPYLVLPFLGPSTLRDGLARVPDQFVSAGNLPSDSRVATGVTLLQVIDVRASLLGVTGLADQVALDKYSFFRQGYLARRLDAVYDGAPPAPPAGDFDDFDDPGDSPPPPAAAASSAKPASAPAASPR